MKKVLIWLRLVAKRMLYFALPLTLFLYVLYEYVFDVDTALLWPALLPFLISIGVTEAGRYKTTEAYEPVRSRLLEDLESSRWKETARHRNTWTLRPKFDYPYSLLSGDTVEVILKGKMASIKGPRAYVEKLVEDLEGGAISWPKKIARKVFPVLPLVIILLPTVFYSGLYAEFKISQHNRLAQAREKVEITDMQAMGNSENNINNDGLVAEYGEWYFLVENQMSLVRVTKDFKEKMYLLTESEGGGVRGLNVVDGWIFYSQGEELKRMRVDGTQKETIFSLGYQMETHVLGDQIYFIHLENGAGLYRMDVNGQNLERIVNKPIRDLAIYENRLYYSYWEDESGFWESVNLEGEDQRREWDVWVNRLIRWEGNDYFLDAKDSRLYRTALAGGEPQLLLESPVFSFVVTGQGIYYSLLSEEAGYQGKGLHKMAHDGTNQVLLADVRQVEGLSQVGDWLFFRHFDQSYLTRNRLDLRTDELMSEY